MTPLETLAKYGLETSVKAIRERIITKPYNLIAAEFIPIFSKSWPIVRSELAAYLHQADLSLLCSLAEKGEALETPKPVKVVQGGCGGTWKMPLCPSCGKDIQSANDFSFRHCPHCGQRLDWKHPITEAEGEGK